MIFSVVLTISYNILHRSNQGLTGNPPFYDLMQARLRSKLIQAIAGGQKPDRAKYEFSSLTQTGTDALWPSLSLCWEEASKRPSADAILSVVRNPFGIVVAII